MKAALLVFFGGFLAIEIQAQFFQYYHTFTPPQPYVPFLQPPVIPQPHFFYHQQFQPLQPPATAFRREEPHVAADNYLGYSYRTSHENGASSTVVFFTGQVKNDSRVFMRPTVTVASDSVDPQQPINVEESIRKELDSRKGKSFASPNSAPLDLFPFVSSILGNSQIPFGTFHYYQTDGLPASTALLKQEESPANITSRVSEEDASESKVEESIQVNVTTAASTESNEMEVTTVEAGSDGESTNEVTTIVNDATEQTEEVASTTQAISTTSS